MSGALNAGVGSVNIQQRSSTADDPGAVDRRRWTSFLTWAFVLAEMAGRDGFLPTAAHAGDDDVGRSTHPTDHAAPVLNNLPNVSVSTANEGPEPVTYQQAASAAPLPGPTPLSGELADAKIASVADVLAHGTAAGGGGGGYGDGDLGHQADSGDASALTMHLGAGEGALVAFNHAGEVLDLGLNLDLSHTAHGLLDGVSDGLGQLPLVGGLLGDLGHTVAGTAGQLLSTLGPVVSLLGIGSDHDASPSSFGVGQPGHLDFGSALPAVNDLATHGGGYTTYGIALNIGAGDSVHITSDAGAHSDAFDAVALDNLASDHLPGSAIHSSSDALHLDQAILRTASDVLA